MGYRIITMLLVAHAKLSPLANHTLLASTFIKLVAMNTCRALIYIFQVPERLGELVSSKLLLHCMVVYSVMVLTDNILTPSMDA